MTIRALAITVPDDLSFSDLKLGRDPDGGVSFDRTAIERICAASGLDPAIYFDAPEGAVAGLIVGWYAAHRRDGGEPDPIAEDLIAEARLEDERGGGISHAPGTA